MYLCETYHLVRHALENAVEGISRTKSLVVCKENFQHFCFQVNAFYLVKFDDNFNNAIANLNWTDGDVVKYQKWFN